MIMISMILFSLLIGFVLQIFGACDVEIPNYGCINADKAFGRRNFIGLRYAKPVQRFVDSEMSTGIGPPLSGYAPGCPALNGSCPDTNWFSCPRKQSEDCLFLNIYTPSNTGNDESYFNETGSFLYPVLFWIHGGAYKFGSGGIPAYNATEFVSRQNVVVVTINYRLGALGFLYYPEYNIHGNYGWNDTKLALKWTHTYIEHFGGDPKKITIFGESAGAMSVGALLSKNENPHWSYIKNAIMESNPMGAPFRLKTDPRWIQFGKVFTEQANCKNLSPERGLNCLKSLKVSQILSAQQDTEMREIFANWGRDIKNSITPWTPTLNEQPFDVFKDPNKYNINTKIIIGNNLNEGILFGFGLLPKKNITSIELDLLLDFTFGPVKALEIGIHYKIKQLNPTNYFLRRIVSKILTDGFFACPLNYINKQIANNNGIGYQYHFNYVWSLGYSKIIPVKECTYAVCHESEIAFVFRPSWDLMLKGASMDSNAKATSTAIEKAWVSLASFQPLPSPWMKYLTSTQNSIVYKNNGVMNPNNFSNANNSCASLWDKFGYDWLNKGGEIIDYDESSANYPYYHYYNLFFVFLGIDWFIC